MLDLFICEFQKLKRRKFIQLTILSAFLFPIPLTILMTKDRMDFEQLFRANVMMGVLLLLPIVLGVIASIIFFSERDNDTLKNILTIPISKIKILGAKISILFLLSILYTVAALGATLIGGLIVGDVSQISLHLGVSIVLGVAVTIASLPIVIIIVASNKSYVFSIITSVLYSVISFAITMAFSSSPEALEEIVMILPMGNIIRWYLGSIPVEESLSYILPYTISTPVFIGIMSIYMILFIISASYFYKRVES